MAFIFQADKKGFLSPSKHETPGPGNYEAQSDFHLGKGYAPFLSTVERGMEKKSKDTKPGPGSYGSLLTFGASMKPNKTFHATLSPDRAQMEAANLSTAFKSKSRRFEYKIDTDQPGPGTYYQDPGFGKALSAVALTLKACTSGDRVRALPDDRTVIPSIPSYSHHYGYTESDGNKLVLNKNPLIEIQQFVGPGYYDIKDMVQVNPNKGTIWHKSATKRFESQSTKNQTKNVIGPGTYEVSNLDGAQPKYKGKASSGFASTTNRPFIGKGKPKDESRGHSRTVDKFSVEFDADQLTSIIVERKDEDDRITDGTIPGPGRYHNEIWSSSMKTSYKPSNLQFFGTTSERFKVDGVGTQALGPGEYNTLGENLKTVVHALSPKDANKIPKEKPGFRSTDLRFKDVKNPTLGPGVYELKTTIIDKVADMAKKGYLGSFGSTEIRFKPSPMTGPMPEEPNEKAELAADLNTTKQAAHYFRSTTEKVGTYAKPQKDIPPPGTYDPDYYDISKRIKDSDSYFSSAKKAPFCSSDARFKGFTASNQTSQKKNPAHMMGDESINLRANKDAQFLKRQAPSSVFNSKSERAASCLPRNALPGPGTYYNTQPGWLKKSYNVKFIEEN